MFRVGFVVAATLTLSSVAVAQEEIVPANQSEEARQVINQNDSVLTLPGQDLIQDTVPSGNQTSFTFPDPPAGDALTEDNTTTVFTTTPDAGEVPSE